MSKEAKERERKERELAHRKETQRIAIEGIGRSGKGQKEKDKEYIKTKGETELKEAGAMIGKSGKDFQHSVKGQFGKKITDVMEKQKQLLDTF